MKRKIKPGGFTISAFLIVSFFVVYSSAFPEEPKVFEKVLSPKLMISKAMGDKDEAYSLYQPFGIATDLFGFIYIIDSKNHRVVKYDQKGKFVTTWGHKGDGPGEFSFYGNLNTIRVDSENRIYVTDRIRNRIQIFDDMGKYINGFSTEDAMQPCSLSVDSEGNVYVARVPTEVENVTVTKYVLSQGRYKLKSKFAPAPFWIKIENPTNREISRIAKFGSSIIIHNKNDEIFQTFLYLPYIRKISPDGKIIWEKYIDLRFVEGLEPEEKKIHMKWLNKADLKRTDLYDYSSFFRFMTATSISIDRERKRVFILKSMLRTTVLELDYDGNLIGAYLAPRSHTYNRKEDDNLSGNLNSIGYLDFTCDITNKRFLFLTTFPGELWESRLQ